MNDTPKTLKPRPSAGMGKAVEWGDTKMIDESDRTPEMLRNEISQLREQLRTMKEVCGEIAEACLAFFEQPPPSDRKPAMEILKRLERIMKKHFPERLGEYRGP